MVLEPLHQLNPEQFQEITSELVNTLRMTDFEAFLETIQLPALDPTELETILTPAIEGLRTEDLRKLMRQVFKSFKQQDEQGFIDTLMCCSDPINN